MDQVPSLSDALLKSSSFLGGLLSQIGGGTCGSPAQDSLFSSLVSGNDALPGAPADPAQATTAQASPPSPATASGSSPAETSSVPTHAPCSIDQALRSGTDLSDALRKVLAALRQNKDGSSAAPPQTTDQTTAQISAQSAATVLPAVPTQDEGSSDTTIATAVASTEGAQSVENPLLPDDAAQTLSDIVAELLLLMQLVIQTLQQTQTAGGTTSAPQNETQIATEISVPAMNDLAAGLATSPAAAETPDQTLILAAVSSAASTDPFIELLQAVEKSAQQLLETFTQVSMADGSATAADFSAVLSDSTASDVIAQLVQLDTEIQNTFAALQQQTQSGLAATTSAITAQVAAATPTVFSAPIAALVPVEVSTTDAGSTTNAALTTNIASTAEASSATDAALMADVALTADAVSTVNASPTTRPSSAVPASGKEAARNATQSPLFPVPVAAPLAQTTTTTTETADTETMATETTASASSPSVGAAAGNIGASAKDNGDLHADSKELLNNGKSFSFDETNTPLNSGLTAGGAQAAGTYNFASTLSAFRAANGGSTGLPGVVDQVILHMNRSVKSGQSQMSVQLQPGDLGKITVKLDFGADGKVQGSVVADNPKTLDMLQKDSRSLERALQDAGLRPEPGSLHFSLGGQKNQNNAGQAAENGGNNSGNGMGEDTNSANGTSLAELADIGAISETYYLTPTGVNIRV